MKRLRDVTENQDWHYKKDSKRFYSGDHGYFPVGDNVNTSEVYKGVTKGKIVKAETKKDGKVLYTVHVKLPKDHPDAYDSNGDPEHDKTYHEWDHDLSKINKPK